MRSWSVAGMTFALAALVMSGCQDSQTAKASRGKASCPVQSSGNAEAKGSCPVSASAEGAPEQLARIEGTAVQTLSAGRYVYVEVNTGTGSVWVAAMEQSVTNGDKVSFQPTMLMDKFESSVLKRTFEQIYFVDSLTTPRNADTMSMPPGHGAKMPPGHGAKMPTGHGAKPVVTFDVKVAPAEGGVTIADMAEQKEKLAGTEVLLRGKVTKYSPAIMDVNWLHVQDGSDKRDLVVTTQGETKVGDTVMIRGRLERDVDIGSGYSYDLIIRNADITVEKPAQP